MGRSFPFFGKEQERMFRSFGSHRSPKTQKKNGKERERTERTLKEQERMKRSVRERTWCPTLIKDPSKRSYVHNINGWLKKPHKMVGLEVVDVGPSRGFTAL